MDGSNPSQPQSDAPPRRVHQVIPREILELISFRPLLHECRAQLLENPVYWRYFVHGRERLVRRAAIMMLAALAIFSISSFMALGASGISLAIWALAYGWCRAFLILRTALATSALVRRQIRLGVLHELYQTRMNPLEISSGWAMEAWLRTVPETVLIFAALYPWGALTGGLAVLLPLTGIIALLMYQGIAALTTARLALDYERRREAVAAGWIVASFLFPFFFWMVVATLGVLLLVPLVFAFQAVTMIGFIIEPGLDLPWWSHFNLGEVAEIMANVYSIAGASVVYLTLVFLGLCVRYLAKGEPLPQVHGYFEHGDK